MNIEMPDGTTITDVPDGMTQSEIMRRYQKVGSAAANFDAGLKNPDSNLPEGLPPWLGAMIVGAGRTTARIGQGVRQLLPGDNTALDQQVASENVAYAPLAAKHPIATGLGESLPAFAVPVGAAASIPATVARAAAAAALPGALEYGTASERAQRAGMGAAGGAAGAGVGYGIGRALSPIRSANPLATGETQALADAAKISLTPAQATGSKVLNSLDGTLSSFPGSASYMAKMQQQQREGFNRAATGLLGEPPASSIANDATTLARQGIGGRIQNAAASVGDIAPNNASLTSDLLSVESRYMRNLTADQKPFVRNSIDDILTATTQGPVPGDMYQAWRSRIGARAQGTSDSEFKGALKGIQKALDSAFDASATPETSAAMATAREQYRNFKTLEPLIEKASMSSSNIPPAQVMSRALATKNSTPEMQNLAQLGQAIGNDYPNSGTAPRMLWQTILSNPLHLLNPLLSVGGPMAYAAAKAIHGAPGRGYLTNKLSPEMERLLMTSGGLLGYGGTLSALPR